MALLISGCAGEDSSSGDVEEYADGDVGEYAEMTCESIETWARDIDESFSALAALGAPDDLVAVQEGLGSAETAMEQGAARTGYLVNVLDEVDAPDIEDGEEFHRELTSVFEEMQQAMDDGARLFRFVDVGSLMPAESFEWTEQFLDIQARFVRVEVAYEDVFEDAPEGIDEAISEECPVADELVS